MASPNRAELTGKAIVAQPRVERGENSSQCIHPDAHLILQLPATWSEIREKMKGCNACMHASRGEVRKKGLKAEWRRDHGRGGARRRKR